MNDCFECVRLIQRYYNCTGLFQMGYSITYKLAFSPDLSCYLTFMLRGLFTGKMFLAPNLTSQTIMALLSRTSSIYENVFFIPSLLRTVEFTSASCNLAPCYQRPAPRILQKLLLTGPGFQIGNPRCHHFT